MASCFAAPPPQAALDAVVLSHYPTESDWITAIELSNFAYLAAHLSALLTIAHKEVGITFEDGRLPRVDPDDPGMHAQNVWQERFGAANQLDYLAGTISTGAVDYLKEVRADVLAGWRWRDFVPIQDYLK